jgi:hypothetical protein
MLVQVFSASCETKGSILSTSFHFQTFVSLQSEKRQKIFHYFSLYFAFNFPFGQEANGKQIKENCLGFRFPLETGAFMSLSLLTRLEKLVPDIPLMCMW